MSIEILEVRCPQQKHWGKNLQDLEGEAEYPYGHDSFKINHGQDYFAFFNRLGLVTYHLAVENNKVIACSAGIIRQIPASTVTLTSQWIKAWYLCDLKAHSQYRGQKLASKMMRKKLFLNYLRCGRAYAISMNPAMGENRIVRLLRRFTWLPFEHSETLNFYTLNYQQVMELQQQLHDLCGSFVFLSLNGVKDLIMKSTGQPLPLLHFQYGPFASEKATPPKQNSVHMFCAPEGSRLDLFLKKVRQADTTASIITHRLPKMNWDFILSSDI